MDSIPQNAGQQPISDDQELAKALAGVLPDTQQSVIPPAPVVAPIAVSIPVDTSMQFQETPISSEIPVLAPAPEPSPVYEQPQLDPVVPTFDLPEAPATPAQSTASGELEDIKKDALLELRPLIDKVTLPSEEKFDTYLMLIRSTDDASLIGPAHTAAQSITDETRRAEALLDIIKEIDYLSHGNQQQ